MLDIFGVSMFTKYPNHVEANQLIKMFEPLFKFTHFNESFVIDKKNNTCTTNYIANNENGWDIIITFNPESENKKDVKQFVPTVKFNKKGDRNRNYDDELIRERRKIFKELVQLVQTTYKPDFDRLSNIISIFVEQGIESGLFKNIVKKKYPKHMKSHFSINHYYGRINFSDMNFGTITFNRLLQKGGGYQGKHYKKSYVSISIEHLIQSDNTIQPYFRIRLPYADSRKGTCIIPLNGDDRMYFMNSDDRLQNDYIDNMDSCLIDEETLKLFFADKFKSEVKRTIASTLKINKSDLEGLNSDELKDYFVLVEMLKI